YTPTGRPRRGFLRPAANAPESARPPAQLEPRRLSGVRPRRKASERPSPTILGPVRNLLGNQGSGGPFTERRPPCQTRPPTAPRIARPSTRTSSRNRRAL